MARSHHLPPSFVGLLSLLILAFIARARRSHRPWRKWPSSQIWDLRAAETEGPTRRAWVTTTIPALNLVPGVSATAPPARLPWVRRAWELGGDAASPADLSSLSDAPAVAELHRLSILVLVGLSSTPLPLQRPPSIRCFTLCAPCRRNKDNEEQDWASGCNLVAESLKKDREAGACWQSQTSIESAVDACITTLRGQLP
ncbi:hypothetical protein EJB05_16247, partial [Eragrostis curvula]